MSLLTHADSLQKSNRWFVSWVHRGVNAVFLEMVQEIIECSANRLGSIPPALESRRHCETDLHLAGIVAVEVSSKVPDELPSLLCTNGELEPGARGVENV
jgi:hypothetical protein